MGIPILRPTRLVSVDATSAGGAGELARRLRSGAPPVVARVADDRVLLDPRAVPPELDAALADAIAAAIS